jgi:hypothetical protein
MPLIFNRNVSSHPLETPIDELEKSGDLRKVAVAINLRHDHRVTVERDEIFSTFCGTIGLGDELWDALDSYHKERIQPLHDPDFVSFDLNRLNILIGHYYLDRPLLNKDVKLASVLDLNGFYTLFLWAAHNRMRKTEWLNVFKDFPNPDFETWLDSKLTTTLVEQENVIRVTFDVLNSYRREVGPYQPSWVTTWNAFKHRAIPGDASGWAKALGVNKLRDRWLIVIKYTVAEAGTLARPTQLDGGNYEWHFPSPTPLPPPQDGGHPMELRIPVSRLLPEYVHQQLREYQVSHWERAGKLIGKTGEPWCLARDITPLRNEHHQLLCRCYGSPEIIAWMPKAI